MLREWVFSLPSFSKTSKSYRPQKGRARPPGPQQAVDITAYIQESIRTKAFQHEQQQPISALATIDPQMAPLNFMYCKERRAHFTAQDIPLDAV